MLLHTGALSGLPGVTTRAKASCSGVGERPGVRLFPAAATQMCYSGNSGTQKGTTYPIANHILAIVCIFAK